MIAGEKGKSPPLGVVWFKGSNANDSESVIVTADAEENSNTPDFGLINGITYLFGVFLHKR